MELYDIIEAASKLVDKSKGFLVLHRGVHVNPRFKVYKRYSYALYLVSNRDKNDRECLLRYETEKNSPAENMDKDWKEQDMIFLSILIDWLSSEHFIKLKHGI